MDEPSSVTKVHYMFTLLVVVLVVMLLGGGGFYFSRGRR
jgi:hypothetical protein